MFRRILMIAAVAASVVLTADPAAAGRLFRRGGGARHATRGAYGGARPVTGRGANIHRIAVLRQESRRASRGLPVRNRGNIRWRR